MEAVTPQIPDGFVLNGISSGIKKDQALDLGMIYSEVLCEYSGVFTTNQFPAAPVQLCRGRLGKKIQALVVNSGNANACNDEKGKSDAESMALWTAQSLGIDTESTLVASTGLIGKELPMNRLESAIPILASTIRSKDSNLYRFAKAIHTTDTKEKIQYWQGVLGAKQVRILGVAKGVGMITPNMATLLVFFMSDIQISYGLLQKALHNSLDKSFHSISIDAHQSTNDSVFFLANGRAKNSIFIESEKDYKRFCHVLEELSVALAKSMVADAEGATKFVTIHLRGAKSNESALDCVHRIAHSILCKTAFFGEDPNWGRFISVIGSMSTPIDTKNLEVRLNGIPIFSKGKKTLNEKNQNQETVLETMFEKMKQYNQLLEIDLNQGSYDRVFYTSDLSYKTVQINADYSS